MCVPEERGSAGLVPGVNIYVRRCEFTRYRSEWGIVSCLSAHGTCLEQCRTCGTRETKITLPPSRCEVGSDPGPGGHPGGPLGRRRGPVARVGMQRGVLRFRLPCGAPQRAAPPPSPSRRVGCVRAWATCGLGQGEGTYTKPYICTYGTAIRHGTCSGVSSSGLDDLPPLAEAAGEHLP